MESTSRKRLAHALGLERNIAAASGAVFLVGLGEELWKKYLPKYLESLGANVAEVGLFGTAEDFFDGVYQYPGGWLADRWGRRRALLIFLLAAEAGYAVYLFSPSWPWLFAGLALVMAWQSMASPAVFATIGDALPPDRRAMGFTIQSILKRLPMATSPLLGAALIASHGIQGGTRKGLLLTIVSAAIAFPMLWAIRQPDTRRDAVRLEGVWSSFRPGLKRLLASDIAIRTCEGMADIFVVLYVTNVTGVSIRGFGLLVAIQLTTSILIYFPSMALAGRVGRRALVIATFLNFALYPIAVVMARSFTGLVIAFIVGGLREIGEPSRKALIVDLAQENVRARSVGLYYLVRSLSITPASAVGGQLWKIRPQIPFLAAGVIGLVGTLLFAATVERPKTN